MFHVTLARDSSSSPCVCPLCHEVWACDFDLNFLLARFPGVDCNFRFGSVLLGLGLGRGGPNLRRNPQGRPRCGQMRLYFFEASARGT